MKNLISNICILLAFLGELQAKDPKELADLVKVQLEIEQRAVSATRGKYLSSLKKMVEEYTKAGKLEEATAARRQLGYTIYGGSWYVLAEGKPFLWVTLYSDGTFVTSSPNGGAWEMEGDSIKISWSKDNWWKLTAAREQDPLAGKASNGTNLRFVRLKPE